MKIYHITKLRKGRVKVVSGTLEELVSYFSYTLECGNSWNPKIKRNPKSFNGLISNLNKSVDEIQGGCFNRDYYREATKEEIQNK